MMRPRPGKEIKDMVRKTNLSDAGPVETGNSLLLKILKRINLRTMLTVFFLHLVWPLFPRNHEIGLKSKFLPTTNVFQFFFYI